MLIRAAELRAELRHGERRAVLLEGKLIGRRNRRCRIDAEGVRSAHARGLRSYQAQVDGRGNATILLAEGVPDAVDVQRVAGEIEDLTVLFPGHAPETAHDGLEPLGVALVQRFIEKQRQDHSLLHLLGVRDARRQQQLGARAVRQLIQFPCFPAARFAREQPGSLAALVQLQLEIVVREFGEVLAGAFEDPRQPVVLILRFDRVDEGISPPSRTAPGRGGPATRRGRLHGRRGVRASPLPRLAAFISKVISAISVRNSLALDSCSDSSSLISSRVGLVAFGQGGFPGLVELRAVEADLALKARPLPHQVVITPQRAEKRQQAVEITFVQGCLGVDSPDDGEGCFAGWRHSRRV